RPRGTRARLRARQRRDGAVRRRGRGDAHLAAAGLPARGQVVPHGRLRVHRWAPPLRRDRRGGRPAPRRGDQSPAQGRGAMSGPRVVAVGGGHGTAVTLRAALCYAAHVAGVVSVADDGGSSGRLRELLDVVALGDLRKCLVAVAAEDSALALAFERRFTE